MKTHGIKTKKELFVKFLQEIGLELQKEYKKEIYPGCYVVLEDDILCRFCSSQDNNDSTICFKFNKHNNIKGYEIVNGNHGEARN